MMNGGLCNDCRGFLCIIMFCIYPCIMELPFKKADGGVPFIWLFTAIAAVVYTPLAIGVVIYEKPEIGIWQLAIIMASILAHLGFFLVLQKGYKKGDLSLVYPIARGTGPLLTCVLAVAFLASH